jgi:hypothetical protein
MGQPGLRGRIRDGPRAAKTTRAPARTPKEKRKVKQGLLEKIRDSFTKYERSGHSGERRSGCRGMGEAGPTSPKGSKIETSVARHRGYRPPTSRHSTLPVSAQAPPRSERPLRPWHRQRTETDARARRCDGHREGCPGSRLSFLPVARRGYGHGGVEVGAAVIAGIRRAAGLCHCLPRCLRFEGQVAARSPEQAW